MTNAEMKRLTGSEFWHDTCENVIAWDYYLHTNNRKAADECMHRWDVAKKALEYITGNLYGFSRNGETVSIVNECDYNDRPFVANAHRDR